MQVKTNSQDSGVEDARRKRIPLKEWGHLAERKAQVTNFAQRAKPSRVISVEPPACVA